MVTDSLARGGKERRLLELIKGLCQNGGYAIKLVCLSENLEYEYVRDLPIEFEILKRRHRFDPFIIRKLSGLVKSFNPDIIHSWGSMASVLLIPVIAGRRVKFVNGIIADAPLKLGIFNGNFLRKWITYPFSDAIVSNSKAGIRSYRAPLRKTECIYNGVESSRFLNLKKKEDIGSQLIPGWHPGLYVAGMVAAFEERKDYRTLIRAAVSLIGTDGTIRFLLVGDGRERKAIEAMVPDELQNHIVFTGKRSDVESIIQLFDVAILLTNTQVHGEGISNSILEYMALGKPVLATRGGGTDEAVDDGKTGYLLDPGDAGQLTRRIGELKSDRNKARLFGQAGAEKLRRQFTLDIMTEQYEKLYSKLINRKKRL